MTVGELRKILDDYDDKDPVFAVWSIRERRRSISVMEDIAGHSFNGGLQLECETFTAKMQEGEA